MPRVIVGFVDGEVDRVRALAVAGFEEARARRWPFLSDVLERVLRDVPAADGAIVTAIVHGLVKYDRLLGFATDGRDDAGARLDALQAMARRSRRDSGEPGEPDGRDDADPLDARIAAIASRTERLGVTFSVPDWLVDLVEDDVGAGSLTRTLARMNELAPRVGRVNPLKTTRDACVEALVAEGVATGPTAHATFGVVLGGRSSLFRTRAFARGEIELQDEASQMVAEVVAPPPGSRVIDACAGAGGKTLALAALLGGRGRVVALDVSDTKLSELRRRARRAGASNVQGIVVDLLSPAERLEPLRSSAARVLVDAPCTGLGAIRRNPELRWRLRPEQVESMSEVQGKLLRAAASLVAPGGRLVYATCSFLKREGENVVERFLEDTPLFSCVTVRNVLGRARTEAIATPDGRYLRTWRLEEAPDGGDAGMDGFFAAVVRLAREASEASKASKASELASGL